MDTKDGMEIHGGQSEAKPTVTPTSPKAPGATPGSPQPRADSGFRYALPILLACLTIQRVVVTALSEAVSAHGPDRNYRDQAERTRGTAKWAVKG